MRVSKKIDKLRALKSEINKLKREATVNALEKAVEMIDTAAFEMEQDAEDLRDAGFDLWEKARKLRGET